MDNGEDRFFVQFVVALVLVVLFVFAVGALAIWIGA